MRRPKLVLASALALSQVLAASGSSATPVVLRQPFATPDANRTKAYFFKFGHGEGSFAVPVLNGFSGNITYYNGEAFDRAKIWTGWATYGSPPPPSNGGSVVAYVVLAFYKVVPLFAGSRAFSTITYAKLNPSKTYSIDMWDVTNTPSEVELESAGSPSNGVLTFESPLDHWTPNGQEVVNIELVQNP